MDFVAFMQTPLFNWVIMPLLIIISRLFDVTLSTIRVVFTARSEKKLAAITAFFEVLIWIIIIRQLLTNFTNPLWIIAYAFGFALGTYLGMTISERLSVGKVIIQVFTRKDATALVNHLRKEEFGVTTMNAQGRVRKNKIIFTVVSTKDIPHIVDIINMHNPKAFYTIEDVRKAKAGKFRAGRTNPFKSPFMLFSRMMKRR